MSHIICFHNGKYNVFSTATDGFLYEPGITLTELKNDTLEDQGTQGLRSLEHCLEIIHTTGTNSKSECKIEDLLKIANSRDSIESISFSIESLYEKYF